MSPTRIEVKYDTSPLGTASNWVTKGGGLPAFIRAIAHALIRNGRDKSKAIQLAIGVCRNWAEGKGKVSAKTRAKAAAAIAQWERLKGTAHAKKALAEGISMAPKLDLKGLTVTSELALPDGSAVLVLDDGRHALRDAAGDVTEMKSAEDYDPEAEDGDDAGDTDTVTTEEIDDATEDVEVVPDGLVDDDDDTAESKGLLPTGEPYDDGIEFKKAFSTEQRGKASKTGEAMPDGSFPIKSTSDLSNAIQAVGRAKPGRRSSVRRHIIKRARALGAASKIPSHWPEKHAAKSLEAGGEVKLYPYLPGSVEERQALLTEALNGLLLPPPPTSDDGTPKGSSGYVSIDGTYADQVIATVRLWNQPDSAEPQTYAVPYTIDGDDQVQLGDPTAVEKVMAIVPEDAGDNTDGTGDDATGSEDAVAGQAATSQASATKGLLDAIMVKAARGGVLHPTLMSKLKRAHAHLSDVLADTSGKDPDDDGDDDTDADSDIDGDGKGTSGKGSKSLALSDTERILMEAAAMGIEIPGAPTV